MFIVQYRRILCILFSICCGRCKIKKKKKYTQ
nr:unnamed protein product [Callosobruchus chinensis]